MRNQTDEGIFTVSRKKMHAAGELAIAHESHWSQVRESKKKNIEKGLHIFPICME